MKQNCKRWRRLVAIRRDMIRRDTILRETRAAT